MTAQLPDQTFDPAGKKPRLYREQDYGYDETLNELLGGSPGSATDINSRMHENSARFVLENTLNMPIRIEHPAYDTITPNSTDPMTVLWTSMDSLVKVTQAHADRLRLEPVRLEQAPHHNRALQLPGRDRHVRRERGGPRRPGEHLGQQPLRRCVPGGEGGEGTDAAIATGSSPAGSYRPSSAPPATTAPHAAIPPRFPTRRSTVRTTAPGG